MKIQIYLFTIFATLTLNAQQKQTRFEIKNQMISGSDEYKISESYFMGQEFEKTECLTQIQRFSLNQEMESNRQKILQKNPNAFKQLKKLTLFQNPFRAKAGFNGYGFHTLNNQVDQNLTPNNKLLDYYCGTRTYDWINGNHQGTDYILWPYPWKNMDENTMEIISASPGIIIVKKDGFSDKNCVNNGNPNWNGVVVQHSDGSTAIYMHFKKNGITSKVVGDAVDAGEFLGLAGSSGSSNTPHLHFEVRDSQNNVIDPYAGACNSMNTESWWANQENYYVPKINRISTHSSSQYNTPCPQPENTYEKVNFNAGDMLYLRIYLRDIQTGDLIQFSLKDPNNNVVSSWNWNSPWPFYATAWAFWSMEITTSWQTGIYTMSAKYYDQIYETQFAVGTQMSTAETNMANIYIYPNPADEILNLKLDNPGEKYTIFAMDGRKIDEQKINSLKTEINIQKLAAGTYILAIQSQGVTRQVKFIKK